MLAGVKPWASSMIRASVVILAALTPLLALPPSPAHACSCRMPSFEEQRAQAGAIFEGRVDEVRPGAEGELTVVFHVTQAWRGVTTERVELRTASNSAACGYAFAVGSHYLVYAHAEGEALSVSLCSRTALADDASEDRQLLGSGTIPVEIADEPAPGPRREPPATRAGCASCSVEAPPSAWGPTLGGLWALALLIRARAARRRRAS
jgi:MYXO-CTERM domain-containing protein